MEPNPANHQPNNFRTSLLHSSYVLNTFRNVHFSKKITMTPLQESNQRTRTNHLIVNPRFVWTLLHAHIKVAFVYYFLEPYAQNKKAHLRGQALSSATPYGLEYSTLPVFGSTFMPKPSRTVTPSKGSGTSNMAI